MENKITLPIGMSNFTEIRKNHYYYIDKTGLIEKLLQNNLSKGTLITRPRRFGKTLAMCMLADFFDIFYIGEGETVYDALMDAYKANKAAVMTDMMLKTVKTEHGRSCPTQVYDVQRRTALRLQSCILWSL